MSAPSYCTARRPGSRSRPRGPRSTTRRVPCSSTPSTPAPGWPRPRARPPSRSARSRTAAGRRAPASPTRSASVTPEFQFASGGRAPHPVGVVLRAADPPARRGSLQVRDLEERRWFQFPEGTDPLWRAYWNGAAPGGPVRDGPVAPTVGECVQAVLWNGTVGLASLTPLGHAWPPGLTVVPLADMSPSRLVVAWNKADANPLIRSLTQVAAAVYRSRPAG